MDGIDPDLPGTAFWKDQAKGMPELLTHSRGVSSSPTAARKEINTTAANY